NHRVEAHAAVDRDRQNDLRERRPARYVAAPMNRRRIRPDGQRQLEALLIDDRADGVGSRPGDLDDLAVRTMDLPPHARDLAEIEDVPHRGEREAEPAA